MYTVPVPANPNCAPLFLFLKTLNYHLGEAFRRFYQSSRMNFIRGTQDDDPVRGNETFSMNDLPDSELRTLNFELSYEFEKQLEFEARYVLNERSSRLPTADCRLPIDSSTSPPKSTTYVLPRKA
jgi:hypothetical protein